MGQSGSSVAALYVYADGIYAGLSGVDIWDEKRDARTYRGPYPVVAHPPCKTWCLMANCRPEIVKGDDGGCFAAALDSVRSFGGVLEHPAHSRAWATFGLPRPASSVGWTRSLLASDVWTCEVDQRWYGHEANKPTWLCYVSDNPPPQLSWGRAPNGEKTVGRSWGQGRDRKRSGTPPAFRDVLLGLARTASAAQPEWCPVCHSYHLDPGGKTDAGRLTRPCLLLPDGVGANHPINMEAVR